MLPLSLAALLACGTSGDPAGEPGWADFELFPSTIVLGEAQLAGLSAAGADGTLHFAAEPAGLGDIAVGDVLLGGKAEGAPAGFLRVVAGVERGGGALTLRTVSAPPQVAFRRLRLNLSRETSIGKKTALLASGDSERSALATSGEGGHLGLIFDGDGDASTEVDRLQVETKLEGSIAWTMSMRSDWGEASDLPEEVQRCLEGASLLLDGLGMECDLDAMLPELETELKIHPSLSMDMRMRGANTFDYEKEVRVGVVDLGILSSPPLMLQPSLSLVFQAKGGPSNAFEIGARATAEYVSHARLSGANGAEPSAPELVSWDLTPLEPTLGLHADAEVRVSTRLAVSLFGEVGPYAATSVYAKAGSDPATEPCWVLRAGLETDIGRRMGADGLPGVGGKSSTHGAFLVDEKTAGGPCELPDELPLPPGGGPTRGAVEAPEFAPWAEVLGGSVRGGSSEFGAPLIGSTQLSRSIDGRWLASGPYFNAVHKVDEGGSLTWTSELVDEWDRLLRPWRTAPTRDAGILALLEPQQTEAFIVAKLSQDGALEWARAHSFVDECTADLRHLFSDGGEGFYVVGDCKIRNGWGWVVHLDGDGEVLAARKLHRDGSQVVVPTAGAMVDGQAVIAGQLRFLGEPTQAFVARLGEEDGLTVSTAFACPERIEIEPTELIPSEGGRATLVGHVNGLGLVARVNPDGALDYLKFPHLGLFTRDWLPIFSVSESRNAGTVIAATFEQTAKTKPRLVLAGLDGEGDVSWAYFYDLDEAEPRPLLWPAAKFTDDGGILVSMIAGGTGEVGEFVAMKVRASDGGLDEGMRVRREPADIQQFDCPYEELDSSLRLGELEVESMSFAVKRKGSR